MIVSVCMAIYNGAGYLIPQVETILSQLRNTDEVVVVDDASNDNSLALLQDLSDARLHLYRNQHNMGVLASFEKALRLARGDILFLSDQDDLWLPGKVEKVMAKFSANNAITLVASDAIVIDGQGALLAGSFFAKRGRFSSNILHNIIKNKFLGCTLAFKKSMLEHFLPLPKDVPMHDMWFGLINTIYGKASYIDHPLIAYRRHDQNLSPLGGAPLSQKLIWRWRLVKHLLPHFAHIIKSS
jgi:glycosyltransferase involved in cell wall biosynthesis